jgi:hypothetical protein
MARIIKSGLIQMSLPKTEGEGSIAEIKEAMVQKHIPYIERAGEQGVQILCLQEIFNTPYFCPGQDKAWYESAEPVPGPTVERMAAYAKKYQMVMIVPVYEKEQAELTSRLLSGSLWNEVKEQRKKLTEIAVALHKKAQAMGLNPAEFTAGDLAKRTNTRNPNKPIDQLPNNNSGLPSKKTN